MTMNQSMKTKKKIKIVKYIMSWDHYYVKKQYVGALHVPSNLFVTIAESSAL